MIVVDTSALVAILKREDDAEVLINAIVGAEQALIGAPTKFEFLLVMGRRQQREGINDAQALLDTLAIRACDWTDAMADVASEALLTFGKSFHPAALNFGDCMAYALAKSLDAPLLYKGDDFAKTDIRSALAHDKTP